MLLNLGLLHVGFLVEIGALCFLLIFVLDLLNLVLGWFVALICVGKVCVLRFGILVCV